MPLPSAGIPATLAVLEALMVMKPQYGPLFQRPQAIGEKARETSLLGLLIIALIIIIGIFILAKLYSD